MKIDNYKITEIIGKGAYSDIYLGKKDDNSKLYAVEKIQREGFDGSDKVMYFKNDIMMMQYLNHPNIVKFEDIKKTKHSYYLFTEYCNGGNLSQALEKYKNKYGKLFSEEIVQHLMRQIIDAIYYMHEQKYLHRNIKLENILLNYANEEDKNNLDLMKADIKLSNLGLSIKENKNYDTFDENFYDPFFLKKLDFPYNKMKNKEIYSKRSDIWSIGSICYEMLIGKLAFNQNDINEIRKNIEEGKCIAPPKSLSIEAVSFLNGMLQFIPTKRLKASQLKRHFFLINEIKDFHNTNLKEISGNNKSDKMTIWCIFKEEDQNILNNILGSQMIKPIDEEEAKEFEKNKHESFRMPSDNKTEP